MAGRGLLTALIVLFGTGGLLQAEEGKIRIVVVSVLACRNDETTDERLKELAAELRKKDPDLKGFKVGRIVAESIRIGGQKSIELVDERELRVRVRERADDGCVSLVLSAPNLLGEIAYSCCCDKFLPIATRHRTADGRQLIIAVMAQTCPKKK